METEGMHRSCSQCQESGARMDSFFIFKKKALASPLVADTGFSGMVHVQALLELGSWSREITSARVLNPMTKIFVCAPRGGLGSLM